MFSLIENLKRKFIFPRVCTFRDFITSKNVGRLTLYPGVFLITHMYSKLYIYVLVGFWTSVLSLLIIVTAFPRLNRWVAGTNCCSFVDDLRGGEPLVIGGTGRWLLTYPLIWRRWGCCCKLIDVGKEGGESPERNDFLLYYQIENAFDR
jgi:hypothetical protein